MLPEDKVLHVFENYIRVIRLLKGFIETYKIVRSPSKYS